MKKLTHIRNFKTATAEHESKQRPLLSVWSCATNCTGHTPRNAALIVLIVLTQAF